TRKVLELAPDNLHALSNLTRFLVLHGQLDEARQAAERLKALTSPREDVWVKKADALSYLGDDQGVLDAWQAACREGEPRGTPLALAMLCHLAGVAHARQGREGQARLLWQQALGHVPGFDLPRRNLDDLGRPPGQRHAPYPYTLQYW